MPTATQPPPSPDRTHDFDLETVPGGAFGAAVYNPFVWAGERLGMAARRRRLLAAAHGSVLEIGAGTGLNLPHYPATGIDELVLAEPVEAMARRIDAPRFAGAGPVRTVRAAAEDLPFEDDSFDVVVSTLVLCTVADPERAVAEICRVLRPAGLLLFCEHVRAERGARRRWQERLARPWAAFAAGCRCDRPTLETIGARMQIDSARRERWRAMPAIVKPLVVGEAVAR